MGKEDCNNNSNPVIMKEDELDKEEYLVNIIHDLRSHINVILSAEQVIEKTLNENKRQKLNNI